MFGLGTAIPLIKDLVDRFIPDKSKAQAAKEALDELRQSQAGKAADEEFQAQLAGLANVKAEAEGKSALQRDWRPIVALTFAGLVVAYWFGFSAPNMPVTAVNAVFHLLELCLGGYVIGNSVERVAVHGIGIAKALKGK